MRYIYELEMINDGVNDGYMKCDADRKTNHDMDMGPSLTSGSISDGALLSIGRAVGRAPRSGFASTSGWIGSSLDSMVG